MPPGDPRFQRAPDFKTAKPRRVRGGLRLSKKEWPPRLGWAAAKWFDYASRAAGADTMKIGHEYARLGQTRQMDIQPGTITGRVQGRVYEAYRVTITIPPLSPETWTSLIGAMAEQAIFSAKLLAGELGPGIDELFESRGTSLLPAPGATGADAVTTACTCGHGEPWCRHACCLALLAAEAIERDPLTLFTLRGLRGSELVERLREGRASRAAAPAPGAARRAIGGPDWPGLRDRDPAPPLDQCLGDFWEAGPELDQVETPLRPPRVHHALLRRLGPSPFEDAKFPLVGLLATCYDTISRAALERRDAAERD